MKVMVFDVGGTEIKYSVMDEQLNRADAGSVPPRTTRRSTFSPRWRRSIAPTRRRWTALP